MEERSSQKTKKLLQKSKVFDVEKPGKAMPSQNARPVMLSHSSLPHVPISVDEDSNSLGDSVSINVEDFSEEPDEIKQRSQKSRIEPVDDMSQAEADEPTPVLDEVAKSDAAEAPEEPIAPDEETAPTASAKPPKRTGMVIEPPTDSTTTETSAKQSDASNEDDIDEINEFAGQAAAKKAKKAEDDAEAKRIAAAQELVASKQYVVPVTSHKASKTLLVVAALLLVVAGAIAAVYWYLLQ